MGISGMAGSSGMDRGTSDDGVAFAKVSLRDLGTVKIRT